MPLISCLSLSNVCLLPIDGFVWAAIYTEVREIVRQTVTVLGIVANDMLPSVTGVACDSVAVVLVEAHMQFIAPSSSSVPSTVGGA